MPLAKDFDVAVLTGPIELLRLSFDVSPQWCGGQ